MALTGRQLDESRHILRPFSNYLRVHRWRDAGRIEEEARVSVENPRTVILELVAAEEARAPRAVGVVVGLFDPPPIVDGAGGSVAYHGRLREDLLHPLVW